MSTELEKLRDKFGSEFGRIDDDGRIYSSGPFPVQIGFIDDDGSIYDTREVGRVRVGYVDSDGYVH